MAEGATNGRSQATNGRRYTQADWRDFAHTGPGTLAGRYLRMFWQPVCVADELPSGRAQPVRFFSEDFTVYRGEGGAPHVLTFRCAHRGTQLSTGWVEGDDLRCFYHGWKYDGSGQCVEQPAEPEPFCQKVRIRSYPVQEYLGLVFAYLGEGEPPPLVRYPEFEHFDGLIEVGKDEAVPCNYFNRMDNAPDQVHASFAHRQLGLLVPHKMEAEETDFGMETRGYTPDGRTSALHFFMPNLNCFQARPHESEETAWREAMAWRMPVDDEHYTSFHVTRVHIRDAEARQRYQERRQQWQSQAQPGRAEQLGRAVLAGQMTMQEVLDAKGVNPIGVQDFVAMVGQGAIAPRENDHLGREDAGIALLRKIWERELARLAAGRPLKQWKAGSMLAAGMGAAV